MVKNGNFPMLLRSSGQEMVISQCYSHLVVKNKNFTLLLTSGGQEWQLNFILLQTSSGQEW